MRKPIIIEGSYEKCIKCNGIAFKDDKCVICGHPGIVLSNGDDLDWRERFDNKIGNLIRDFTQVGSIPKSEGKRRINELISEAEERGGAKMAQTIHHGIKEIPDQIRRESRQSLIQEAIKVGELLKTTVINPDKFEDEQRKTMAAFNSVYLRAIDDFISKLKGMIK